MLLSGLLALLGAHQVCSACSYGPQLRSCGQNNTDFSGCIDAGLDIDIPRLKDGVPALHLSPIDPLTVPAFTLKSRNGKTVQLSSCVLTGGSQSLVSSFSTDHQLALGHSNYTLTVPKFRLSCAYKMEAGYLSAPRANSGNFLLSMPGYASKFYTTTTVRTICNKLYLVWKTVKSTFVRSNDFKASFTGLTTSLNSGDLHSSVISALEPAQAAVTLKFLQNLYNYFPPALDWAPLTTSSNVPFCLAPQPTSCSG